MIDPHLPLIDLHHHLDGSVRIQTILDLSRLHNLELPAWDVESLRPFVQVTDPQPDILAFFNKFEYQTGILVDCDAVRRVAFENVEDAAKEGIDYIELRFSPIFMAQAHGLEPPEVVEAVCDGAEAGSRQFGIKVNLTGIISRTFGVESAWQELDSLLTQKEHITALDLAGDELHFPGSLFVEHFQVARNAGWHVTIHAGEADGPQSVWQALRELGAERIGHAVHAPEDPALMDYLREHEIGIESNLTSNVQTSTVASYATHPLKLFLEKGLKATINTDDPGISAIDLHYEYEVAAPKSGLSEAQIHQAQRNALEVAFLSSQEKMELLSRKSVNG